VLNKMSGYNNFNQYANISNFGSSIGSSNNPLTMCLTETCDRSFQNGGAIGHLTGPRSTKCQYFMAERCAKNWDGYCEYFYKENGKSGQWGYTQPQPNVYARRFAIDRGLTKNLTSGEQLLHNAAELKYCQFLNCTKKCEKFNENDPTSPYITYYVGSDGTAASCVPTCNVDPSTDLDNDYILNKMLDNPEICGGTLVNIFNTSKNMGTDLSGTRIGRARDLYFQQMGQNN
jgi:hypothetical protein